MPTETSGTLAQDTLDYLADAKKGKVRRFVMIAKGSSVVSLIVYKKGSLEKLKKEAKEAGKGQVVYGAVEGSGQSMTFMLSTEDGFTDAPVKNSVLKSFLSEGGYTCKPEFQIVPVLPDVADDDVEKGVSPSDSAPAATSDVVPPETTRASFDLSLWQSLRLQVIQSLKELAKAIAAAKDPDSAAAIIELKSVIANLTESPTEPQQIVELRRYMADDEVVADVCDFAFDFRQDLLAALPEPGRQS